MSFTKPVPLPENVIKLILDQKLIQITFVPSVYDYDDDGESDDEKTTGIEEWSIKEISEHGMLIKFAFRNANMISYSIHETDLVDLDIDLRSLAEENSELYGRYVKSVPIQYPE